jgi:zinc protease
MCEIVETRLREVIREEKSGTYGVSVNGDISGISERSYLIQINFECNPEREEELANATLEFLRDLQTNGIEKSYTDNICENRIRSAETDLQDNNWWLNRIVNSKVFEDEPENVVDLNKKGIVASWITPEIIQTSAQQYFDLENYVVVYLKPEKK